MPGNSGRGGAGERPQRDAYGPIVLRPSGHQGPRLLHHQLLPAQPKHSIAPSPWTTSLQVTTTNKHKTVSTLLGAFSGHCESLQRLADSFLKNIFSKMISKKCSLNCSAMFPMPPPRDSIQQTRHRTEAGSEEEDSGNIFAEIQEISQGQ